MSVKKPAKAEHQRQFAAARPAAVPAVDPLVARQRTQGSGVRLAVAVGIVLLAATALGIWQLVHR